MCQQCDRREERDDVRWLAMLVRQGLKLIVVGIERRYHLGDAKATSERDSQGHVSAPR